MLIYFYTHLLKLYFFKNGESVGFFFSIDGGRVEYTGCNNSPHVQCMRALLAATRGRFLLYLFDSSSHMIES
jgi:hypothetical protein